VAKSEWGTKRICQDCGIPFYDLKKKNIECPKCGAAFSLAPPPRPKRPSPVASKPVVKKTPLVADSKDDLDADVVLDVDVDDDDDEDDDSLIEDTSDLGTEDDDLSEIQEHIDDGVEDKI